MNEGVVITRSCGEKSDEDEEEDDSDDEYEEDEEDEDEDEDDEDEDALYDCGENDIASDPDRACK